MKCLDEFLATVKAYMTYITPSTWKCVLAIVFVTFLLFCVIQNAFFREGKSKTIIIQFKHFAFIFEVIMIFCVTLLGRERGEMRWEYIPFASWHAVLTGGNMALLVQIIGNVLLFVPLGFLLPCCFVRYRRYRCTILSAAFLSLVIELIQGIAQIGLFEADDIIHNALGAWLGFLLFRVYVHIKDNKRGIFC